MKGRSFKFSKYTVAAAMLASLVTSAIAEEEAEQPSIIEETIPSPASQEGESESNGDREAKDDREAKGERSSEREARGGGRRGDGSQRDGSRRREGGRRPG